MRPPSYRRSAGVLVPRGCPKKLQWELSIAPPTEEGRRGRDQSFWKDSAGGAGDKGRALQNIEVSVPRA